MRAIGYQNNNFNFKEPFKGLFTQGMVCHETYKDQGNIWRSPEEVSSDDGKNYTSLVKAAGGRALWINEEGLVHGFLRARREVEGASSSFKRMINLLLMLGSKEWILEKR